MLAFAKYWWERINDSSRGQLALKILRGVFLAAILGFLAYKLYTIGWSAVWKALPTQPFFYLFFFALYMLLPLTEMLIYRVVWGYGSLRSLPVFLKKRIYNKEVMSYSGEVLFFTWARKHVDLPEADMARTIRDNNIISSAASTFIAVVLLGIFLYLGQLDLSRLIKNDAVWYWIGGAVVLALLVPLGLRFRKYIFSMPIRLALTVFGIQIIRLIIGQSLQIGQWSVVMPDVNFSTWLTFAAVSVMLTRIPFIPSHNLLLLGVGVELSTSLGIPEAAMFSMLAALAAMDKATSFGLFLLISLRRTKTEGDSALSRQSEAEWILSGAALPDSDAPAPGSR